MVSPPMLIDRSEDTAREKARIDDPEGDMMDWEFTERWEIPDVRYYKSFQNFEAVNPLFIGDTSVLHRRKFRNPVKYVIPPEYNNTSDDDNNVECPGSPDDNDFDNDVGEFVIPKLAYYNSLDNFEAVNPLYSGHGVTALHDRKYRKNNTTRNNPPNWSIFPSALRPGSHNVVPGRAPCFSVRDKNLDFAIDVAALELIEVCLSEKKGRNVVCSPFSLNVALSMVVPGAKGRTLEQFLSLLKADNVEEINSRSSKLMQLGKSCNSNGEECSDDMRLANAFFFGKKFAIKPCYRDFITRFFEAVVISVDFTNKEEAGKKLNEGWADRVTNERMKKLLPPIKPPSSLGRVSAVIVNVLYFKAKWASVFETYNTRNDKFHLLDGTHVDVPFMHKPTVRHHYGYAKLNGYQILKMPYETTPGDWKRLSMIIVVPDDLLGLPKLVFKFKCNPDEFIHCPSLREDQVIDLKLPKFKFSYEFSPMSKMIELGLNLPFMGDNNDITEIFCGQRCVVSDVTQSTMIEVNEKGTEVISRTVITSVSPFGCCVDTVKPIEVVVDHPFMFMIKEDVSDIVLCMGTVLNPLLE